MALSYSPYKDEGLNNIYNMLFCDDIAAFKQPENPIGYPWDDLWAQTPDSQALTNIATDQTLESRQRLLAYRKLAGIHPITSQELLGVVIEVALDAGLDVLAAYKDGSARYMNHTGKLLVWDANTSESDILIEQLYAYSRKVVSQIGPWEEARKPFPSTPGTVRLSFLVSDGLYFGEGPFDVLQQDGMGGPVIASATQLMMYLTQYTPESQPS